MQFMASAFPVLVPVIWERELMENRERCEGGVYIRIPHPVSPSFESNCLCRKNI
jgi:hypothetical protein